MHSVGFIGLGVMGEPMAQNLLRAETPLLVWNRTPAKARALEAAGAAVAPDTAAVFARSEVVILMVTDGEAADAVLGRGTPEFAARVSGRTIVHMSNTPPEYSQDLESDVRAVGGCYVEAPVLGSRLPAEAGELVAMLAGDQDAVEAVRPLLAPVCREMIFCGPVPSGHVMKLSTNVCLVSVLAGLAEAVEFARRYGVDMAKFVQILGTSQMSSPILRVKALKMADEDFSVQGSIALLQTSTELTTAAAAAAGIATPLLDASRELLGEAIDLGLGDADVAALVKVFQARSERGRTSPARRPAP
jgi:3-hydroxyisobutyrate dehydrogenase